jgi:hypothetical protein
MQSAVSGLRKRGLEVETMAKIRMRQKKTGEIQNRYTYWDNIPNPRRRAKELFDLPRAPALRRKIDFGG